MSDIKHTAGDLDYSRWMSVDHHLLSDAKRTRFLRLKSAIEAACNGVKSSVICRTYQTSRSGLSYLLKRCTSRHHDGFLWGYRALVNGCRQEAYNRVKHTSISADSDGAGLAGAFQRLLVQHPEIDKIIRRTVRSEEAGIQIKSLHGRIVDYLRKKTELTAKDYPFNTKTSGYASLAKYVRDLIANGDHELAEARYGSKVHDGLQRDTGKRSVLRPLLPLEIACYDEQQLPFIGTITIEVNGKENHVPLCRGYLCILVDEASASILGYSIAISTRFKALDLLRAFEGFIHPWKPLDLRIPNLKYVAGAGLPSGVVPEAQGRRISIISVDNHLSHLANSIVSHLRVRTGAIIRFGKVRQWIARYAVEGIFSELQTRGFQRIPSTTGSGIDDPHVDDPVGKAVNLKIRMEDLVELIDVLIANQNAKPRPSLMAKTANEVMASELDDARRLSVIPKFSEAFMKDPQVAVEIISVTVRGSREAGRPPYVQLDGVHYSNDGLHEHWSMIGKPLLAHIKGDYRKIRVFREDGTEYGVLAAGGCWSLSFHTREMRKEILQLNKDRLLEWSQGDPVIAYSNYLAKKATRNSHKKKWAAAGFKDTLLRWSMKQEIANGNEKAIQPGVQG